MSGERLQDHWSSGFSIELIFMIKYAKVFDKRFIGRVIHNFTFHYLFARFSYVLDLQRDVKEIMPITCPAFHVQPMLSKFTHVPKQINRSKI